MMQLYSILDKATGAYSAPFAQPSNAAAVRVVRNEMANPDSMFTKYPTDYELWNVGSFDETTGYLTPNNERVVSLYSLKNDA